MRPPKVVLFQSSPPAAGFANHSVSSLEHKACAVLKALGFE